MSHGYGYVYCLTNKYMPELCKIGYTDKLTSQQRAYDLSMNTSCPDKFDVIFDIKVKNADKYEKRIHNKLKKYRINKNREFFKCDPYNIIKYFNKEYLIKNDRDIDDFYNNYLTIYIDEKKNTDNKKQNNIIYYLYGIILFFILIIIINLLYHNTIIKN